MKVFCSNFDKAKKVCQSGTEHFINYSDIEAIQVIINFFNVIKSTVNAGTDELKYTLSERIKQSLKIKSRQLTE